MKHLPLVVCLPLLLLYSIGVVDHDLWTPDEPRVAAVGRSVAEGNWLTPQLNGRLFLEQPPLHAWCVGALYSVFGFERPELARILSSLFGLGGLVFAGLLAARLVDPHRAKTVGLLTALALGLSLEYFTTAHRVVVDGLLTLLTTASAFFLHVGLEPTEPRRGRWSLFFGFLCMALAFMTKGPIGLAVPGLFGCAWMLSRRQVVPLVVSSVLLGIPALVVVVAPWLYFAYVELGPETFRLLFVDNTWERVFSDDSTRSHLRPFYYYIAHFPPHFLPTIFVFVAVLVDRVVRRGTMTAAERHAYDLPLLWFLLGFVMLSVASTKRAVYLMPLFPAAAIPCGVWLAAFLEKEVNDRYAAAVPRVLTFFLAVAGVLAPFCRHLLDGVGVPDSLAAFVAGGVSVAIIFWAREARERSLTLWLGGFTLAVCLAVFGLVTGFDQLKSLREVTCDVSARVPKDEPLYTYDPDETTEALFPLYTGRLSVSLFSDEAVRERLAEHGTMYLVAIDKSYRRRQRRLDALKELGARVIFEDVRLNSRAFRLLVIEQREGEFSGKP